MMARAKNTWKTDPMTVVRGTKLINIKVENKTRGRGKEQKFGMVFVEAF